jgi:hypothetical protein
MKNKGKNPWIIQLLEIANFLLLHDALPFTAGTCCNNQQENKIS